jgi:hypothetical protein
MHLAAFAYVRRAVRQYGPWDSAVEIGSRNINGSVRRLFPDTLYTGLDIVDGDGVDVVTAATDWKPVRQVGCVVCCEVLEHDPSPDLIVGHAASWLELGGHLIVTCAGPGRAPHSAVDGGDVRDGEHYRNVGIDELCWWATGAGLTIVEAELVDGDTRMVAQFV